MGIDGYCCEPPDQGSGWHGQVHLEPHFQLRHEHRIAVIASSASRPSRLAESLAYCHSCHLYGRFQKQMMEPTPNTGGNKMLVLTRSDAAIAPTRRRPHRQKITRSDLAVAVGATNFVYGIFGSLFLFFNSFALNQFLQYRVQPTYMRFSFIGGSVWSPCSQRCQSPRWAWRRAKSHFWYDDEGDRVQVKTGADDGHQVKDVMIPKGRSATDRVSSWRTRRHPGYRPDDH